MATISSREFNQNVSAAKRAAQSEPVIITDRGLPAHVLISIEHYRRLTGEPGDIVRMLAMAEEGLEFEPVRLEPGALKVPDFA
ncbi:MAG: type II toxin-antitoxin system Phd/YefM family antitoxin [Trueperaceae bacterium]